MKEKQQIKALAELDGWRKRALVICYPDYLNSYDAILPLLQKQSPWVRQLTWVKLCFALKSQHTFMATPAQFCEALLRSKRKWIE